MFLLDHQLFILYNMYNPGSCWELNGRPYRVGATHLYKRYMCRSDNGQTIASAAELPFL